ncbi:hypothetical protein BDV95DRAFT_112908 [Massariosphaeria phaeospora]|uniref:Uncharacterized protein n=1 Tax=Massariosphaeria phaeospora TaxID=100035 RepID=A0A7C8MK70_9PLEO|nr:hypothetical protein BDV95DRAFT_112908 [Massariosphaeria phaeospora]
MSQYPFPNRHSTDTLSGPGRSLATIQNQRRRQASHGHAVGKPDSASGQQSGTGSTFYLHTILGGPRRLGFDCRSAGSPHATPVRRPGIMTAGRSNQGCRKYFNKNPAAKPLANRVGYVLAFNDALDRHTIRHGDFARHFSLREVGYSNRSHSRLQEHRCHDSSNPLMNLIDAICAVEFPDTFHLDQYVIAWMFAPAQAPLSEILSTRLADGEYNRAL